MAATTKTKTTTKEPAEIQVVQIQRGHVELYIKGREPLILNRMAEKAKRTLLVGGQPKSRAEKAANEKHDPPSEFRDSAYRHKGDDRPTRLYLPSTAFKKAISTAALDMPGATKTQIGRLVWVQDRYVDIWGVPCLSMMVVRSADQKRTPDIRTRAVLQQWACRVVVSYAMPLVTPEVITNLLTSGGFTCGVGDFRQEKGCGSFGQFEPTGPDDPKWQAIVANGGRAAQDAALAAPTFFDDETEELFCWYQEYILAKKSTKRVRLGDDRLPEVAPEVAAKASGRKRRRAAANGEAG